MRSQNLSVQTVLVQSSSAYVS